MAPRRLPGRAPLTVRVALAQPNLVVGDLAGNGDAVVDAIAFAEAAGADILVLPELALPGYPPEDLLLAEGFVDANLAVLDRVASHSGRFLSFVGVVDHAPPGDGADPDATPRRAANAVAVIADGRVQALRHKSLLPNYGVFDEARYFRAGPRRSPALVTDWGAVIGVAVCEDLWTAEVADAQAMAGAQILVVANASPYHQGKPAEREALVAQTARRTGMPVVYTNLVGGQDEIVFDGGSFVVDADGDVLGRLAQFSADRAVIDVPLGPLRHRVDAIRVTTGRTSVPTRPARPAGAVPDRLDPLAELYSALVLGVRDYVTKNRFPSVIIGLSGGIDSALVATLAADALGADRVWGVGMPGPYSSGGSVDDARALATSLGVRFDVLPIGGIYDAALATLGAGDTNAAAPGPFTGTGFGVAEENLQARARGSLLMALSNKHGGIVLTTGNKSETAVGYATLYGDMAGGYAPLRDVFKTDVFALCRWRNDLDEAGRRRLGLRGPNRPIPDATLTKPPSAELAPDQRDDQSLPPYETLDTILRAYIEEDRSPSAIIAAGADPAVVHRVVGLVDRAEYKRRQAPPGLKVTRRAFGRDRRLPITARWTHTDTNRTALRPPEPGGPGSLEDLVLN